MNRIYLFLLVVVLFAGQVSAQNNAYYKDTIRLNEWVHFIKAGSNTHSFNENKQRDTMRWSGSKDYGYMKFRIDTISNGNYEAWVYSGTGHNNDRYRFVRRQGNNNTGYKPQHYAITDTTYTGKIYIPSYICTDGSNKIPVVGIEDNAFAKLQLLGDITIKSYSLKHIGYYAFEAMASGHSYQKVTIKTKQNLTIKERAFKNSFFTYDEFIRNRNLTRGNCNILETRNCLKEVNIESSKGITINNDAFVFSEVYISKDLFQGFL